MIAFNNLIVEIGLKSLGKVKAF